MRFALAALCAAAACSAPAPRCDLTVTRDLAFTDAQALDSVTARAIGPSCDRAVGLYDVRSADGHPIWAWTSPLQRAFGDVFPATEHETMTDFLERWAQPTLTTTQQAPDWPLLAPGQTTLDRLTYDDIRARDLPMLCHASGTARETCVFWEPAAGGAGHLLDRDAQAEPS
jgi:hypothetical protein